MGEYIGIHLYIPHTHIMIDIALLAQVSNHRLIYIHCYVSIPVDIVLLQYGACY